MNQATFQIDETSDVKLVQAKVTQAKVNTEKVTQEKDKIAEVVKNSAITTTNAPIKKPIQKVENIYYL
jgi:hypothetical protein